MNSYIGYKGTVEITIKNKTYRRLNQGCPELFKTLAMCLCRLTNTELHHVPTYITLLSSTVKDTVEVADLSKLSNFDLLNIRPPVNPYVEMIDGNHCAVFTSLILPDYLKSSSSLTEITAVLLANNGETILAATSVNGDMLESLRQGYSAQIKWIMEIKNKEG